MTVLLAGISSRSADRRAPAPPACSSRCTWSRCWASSRTPFAAVDGTVGLPLLRLRDRGRVRPRRRRDPRHRGRAARRRRLRAVRAARHLMTRRADPGRRRWSWRKPATADTSIVVADDHAVVRTGLRMLLDAEEGFEVVAEAADVPGAIAAVQSRRPAVVVLDLAMPGGSSLDAIVTLRASTPETAIVVLTMHDDPAFARRALRDGALGFVLKEAADEELLEAVRLAARGEHVPQPEARGAAGDRAGRARRAARRPDRPRGRRAAADRPRAHQRRDRCSQLYLSRCARWRPIAPTSSASSTAPAAPSSSATRWSTGCSSHRRRPHEQRPRARVRRPGARLAAAPARPPCVGPTTDGDR